MEPERVDIGAEQTAPEIEPTIEDPTGGGGADQEAAEVASPNASEVVMHRLLQGTRDAPPNRSFKHRTHFRVPPHSDASF